MGCGEVGGRGVLGIGANLLREACGGRGIPALSQAESGGMRRTPNASRSKLAPMGVLG